ncbi:MAG: hypothetical protein J6X32_10070 [Salinivirgaceae bacterium]|nr:hypothetical protein [Salinivirgaceae bacterium]
MTYSALEKKLHTIPEEYFEQISLFLDSLISVTATQGNGGPLKGTAGHPIPGLAKGKYQYPENINLGDEEIAQMFECK